MNNFSLNRNSVISESISCSPRPDADLSCIQLQLSKQLNCIESPHTLCEELSSITSTPFGKTEIENSLSAVLKDFQLASVQFCAVQLGDGILHVAAWCKLHHPVLKKTFIKTQVGRRRDWKDYKECCRLLPFISVGSVCIHKGNLPCLSHQVFQVLLQTTEEVKWQRRHCRVPGLFKPARRKGEQAEQKLKQTVLIIDFLCPSDKLPFQWGACQQRSNTEPCGQGSLDYVLTIGWTSLK